MPEPFEAQVERTPYVLALVYDKEEVSYRELDNQANRVSRHLRSLGVAGRAGGLLHAAFVSSLPGASGKSLDVALLSALDPAFWTFFGPLNLAS